MTTRFERQLKSLHVQMIAMGNVCEKAISLSAKAIQGKSKDYADLVFEADREIEMLCMLAEWVEYSITGVHRNYEHQLGTAK